MSITLTITAQGNTLQEAVVNLTRATARAVETVEKSTAAPTEEKPKAGRGRPRKNSAEQLEISDDLDGDLTDDLDGENEPAGDDLDGDLTDDLDEDLEEKATTIMTPALFKTNLARFNGKVRDQAKEVLKIKSFNDLKEKDYAKALEVLEKIVSAPETKTSTTETGEISDADLREATADVRKLPGGTAKIKELMAKVGATKYSEVPQEKRKAFINSVKKIK